VLESGCVGEWLCWKVMGMMLESGGVGEWLCWRVVVLESEWLCWRVVVLESGELEMLESNGLENNVEYDYLGHTEERQGKRRQVQRYEYMVLSGSETSVNVLKCAVKECGCSGMCVDKGATVTATQCEFMENSNIGISCYDANTKARLNDCKMHHNGSSVTTSHGLYACGDPVVDLHGTKTEIHSNRGHGIIASLDAKVNVHLPSQHNTSHDNVGDDRHQGSGGSIANINADGTFTHVHIVVGEEDD